MRVTLDRITGIAARLNRWRPLWAAVALLAALWFVAEALFGSTGTPRSLWALNLLLWAVLALGIGLLLPRRPAEPAAGDGFWRRVERRVLISVYGLAVLFALGLVGFNLLLTWRTLGLSFD